MNPNNVMEIRMNKLSLKRLPVGIGENTPSVKKFYSWHGNIEFIDRRMFKDMTGLSELWLNGNKMKFLPEDVFWDQKNLTDLTMSGNQIENLPKHIFSKLLNLKTAGFSGNRLTHLDVDLFRNNLKLEMIWFEYNKLKVIKVDFTLLPNINFIDLDNGCVNSRFCGSSGLCRRTLAREETVQELQAVINRNCAGKW